MGALELLDGFSSHDPMRARFSVALKSTAKVDDPAATDYTDVYAPRTVSLSVVNVTPGIVANSMQLNDMNVANGGTMPGNVPVGVEARFSARVFDASSVDLAATGEERGVAAQLDETKCGLDIGHVALVICAYNIILPCPQLNLGKRILRLTMQRE